MDDEDKILAAESLEGNQKSFEKILNKYYEVIYKLSYKILRDRDNAEEITQSVFVKAYENLGSYNSKFKFFSWLYRIAVNESINFTKRNKNTEYLREDIRMTEDSPEELYESTELSEKVHDALMKLDMLYRLPVVLKHFLDYSYKELSELLGVPEKTVKSRLFTGRQLLKELLKKENLLQK